MILKNYGSRHRESSQVTGIVNHSYGNVVWDASVVEFRKKKENEREIDWFLNFMKRILGAQSEVMLPGSVCLVVEKKVFFGNITSKNFCSVSASPRR